MAANGEADSEAGKEADTKVKIPYFLLKIWWLIQLISIAGLYRISMSFFTFKSAFSVSSIIFSGTIALYMILSHFSVSKIIDVNIDWCRCGKYQCIMPQCDWIPNKTPSIWYVDVIKYQSGCLNNNMWSFHTYQTYDKVWRFTKSPWIFTLYRFELILHFIQSSYSNHFKQLSVNVLMRHSTHRIWCNHKICSKSIHLPERQRKIELVDTILKIKLMQLKYI